MFDLILLCMATGGTPKDALANMDLGSVQIQFPPIDDLTYSIRPGVLDLEAGSMYNIAASLAWCGITP